VGQIDTIIAMDYSPTYIGRRPDHPTAWYRLSINRGSVTHALGMSVRMRTQQTGSRRKCVLAGVYAAMKRTVIAC